MTIITRSKIITKIGKAICINESVTLLPMMILITKARIINRSVLFALSPHHPLCFVKSLFC